MLRLRLLPVSPVPSGSEVTALVDAVLDPTGVPVLPVESGRPEVYEQMLLAADGAGPDGTALAVATSGSTGNPRVVLLSRDCLVASATAALQRLGGPGGWTLALSIAHIAGIQVALRARLAGLPLVVCPPGGDGSAEAFRVATGRLAADRRYTSLVPTQLRRLLDADAGDALRRYDAVLLGGAAADALLLQDAAAAGVAVVTTYGMSETSGGCVYDGVPLDGVGVEVTDGSITLSGPTVALGYLDGARFGGTFATSDVGRLVDGRLEVLGRNDAMISTGAQLVAPSRVEAALLGLDGIEEAAVLGWPDREWGAIVVAVVVGAADPTTVRPRLAAALSAHEIPKRVLAIPAMPRIGIGKVDYAAVRGIVAGLAADDEVS